MDPRQKEFPPSAPVVRVDVKMSSFAGPVGHPCGIHQQCVICFIRDVCVQVARELSSLPGPAW